MTRQRLGELLAPELRPFLSYSLAAHAAAALLLVRLLPGAGKASSQIYTIDFVGPSATILTSGPGAAAKSEAPSGRPPPQAPVDAFGRRRRGMSLPRPSLLRGLGRSREEPAPAAPAASAPASDAAASGAGDAGVSADMPNFPYPWYLAQLRAALWNLWSSRMPSGRSEAVVVFSVLRDGTVVDLRTEESSGDSAFDLLALGVVQDAAPFAPLPRGFSEPFLKIHVTFKSQ